MGNSCKMGKRMVSRAVNDNLKLLFRDSLYLNKANFNAAGMEGKGSSTGILNN